MRRYWACPTCGEATHSKEALVRSSEKSCSCDSALWVASDMPPCVGKLQEEIAALEESLAERWENLNVQDGVIAKQQEEIAALKSKVEMLETIECKYIEEIQEYAALKEEG